MQNPETLNLFLIILTVAVVILTLLLTVLVATIIKIARDIQWMSTLARREAQGLFQYIDEMRHTVDNNLLSKGLLVEGVLMLSKLFSGNAKKSPKKTKAKRKS